MADLITIPEYPKTDSGADVTLPAINSLYGFEYQVNGGKDIICLDFAGHFSEDGHEYLDKLAAGDVDTEQHLIDAIGGNGGLAVLAHIYFPYVDGGTTKYDYWTSAEILQYTDPALDHRAVAVEICVDDQAKQKAWDDALMGAAASRNIYALASDDGHTPGTDDSNYLGRHTYAWVRNDSLAALKEAITNGWMVCAERANTSIDLPVDFMRVGEASLDFKAGSNIDDVTMHGVSGGVAGETVGSIQPFDVTATWAYADAGVTADTKYARAKISTQAGTFWAQAIKLAEDGTLDAATNPYQSLPADGKWVKINTHTHTIGSDGQYDPLTVQKMYAEAGYHCCVITDHQRITKPVYGNVGVTKKRLWGLVGLQHDTTENPLHYPGDKGGVLGLALSGVGGAFYGPGGSLDLLNQNTNEVVVESSDSATETVVGMLVRPRRSTLSNIWGVADSLKNVVAKMDKTGLLYLNGGIQLDANRAAPSGLQYFLAKPAGAWKQGQAVRCDGDGSSALADSGAEATCHALGLVAYDASGATVRLVAKGPLPLADWTAVTGSADLTPGAPYYVGAAGALTTVKPANAHYVGQAYSTRVLMVG